MTAQVWLFIFIGLIILNFAFSSILEYINDKNWKNEIPTELKDFYNKKKYLKAKIIYNGPIIAPIKKDDVIGKLIINYKNEILSEHDLLAFEKVDKVNIFTRLIRSINYLIWGDV